MREKKVGKKNIKKQWECKSKRGEKYVVFKRVQLTVKEMDRDEDS